MARKPRVWYPGAVYHVMCRGNHRQEIFRDDVDRYVYLEHLLRAKEDYCCSVLSYCLMTNHVHLQIATTHLELWRLMKQLNMRYVVFFNTKYDLVGRLFQGRYRAELIKTHGHNLKISKYIHLNPVVAAMVKKPEDYPWSSYRDYLGEREDILVSTEQILQCFPKKSRECYRKFVEVEEPVKGSGSLAKAKKSVPNQPNL